MKIAEKQCEWPRNFFWFSSRPHRRVFFTVITNCRDPCIHLMPTRAQRIRTCPRKLLCDNNLQRIQNLTSLPFQQTEGRKHSYTRAKLHEAQGLIGTKKGPRGFPFARAQRGRRNGVPCASGLWRSSGMLHYVGFVSSGRGENKVRKSFF